MTDKERLEGNIEVVTKHSAHGTQRLLLMVFMDPAGSLTVIAEQALTSEARRTIGQAIAEWLIDSEQRKHSQN